MVSKDRKIFGQELRAILGVAENLSEKIDTSGRQIINSDNLMQLSISKLQPGRFQPRKNFDDISIQELADSIKEHGILQPLIVKKNNGIYEIIIGERRWRAAEKAGLTHVPAVVCNISDETALAYGLIENIQRKELNAIEEAQAVSRLINEYSLTHEQVAKAIGRARASITNLIRLLALPEEIQSMIAFGSLEMGHARALLLLEYDEQQKLAKNIIEKKLSVRETEKLARALKSNNKERVVSKYDDKINDWQKKLSSSLQLDVKIKVSNEGQGRMVIFFDSPDVLEWFINKIDNLDNNKVPNLSKR